MKRIFPILLFLISLITIQASAQSKTEADSLHNLGRTYLFENKIAEGKEATRQAMEMRRALFGEVNEDYITSLNNYALAISMEGDYEEAQRLQQQVMALCDKLPAPHPKYGIYALNMGRYGFINDDYKTAAKYLELSLQSLEKFSEMYGKVLTWLSICYIELNDNEGQNRTQLLIDEVHKRELEKPCDEPDCMIERAQYYAQTGDYVKAKEYFLAAMKMPMTDEQKVSAYAAYGYFLAYIMKDHSQSAEYYDVAATTQLKIDGKQDKRWANLLYHAAIYNFIGSVYNKSIEQHSQLISYYNKTDDWKKLADNYEGRGKAYGGLKDYAKASDDYSTLVALYEQNDTTTEDYPKAILRLAKAQKFNKDYEQSVKTHFRAMAIFERMGMTEQYTDAASSLQLCYAYMNSDETVDLKIDNASSSRNNKINEILQSELQGLELTRTNLGELSYTNALATIAGCYGLLHQYDNCINYYEQYISSLRGSIRDQFRLQSEKERMIIWQAQNKDVNQLLELLSTMPQDNPSLSNRLSAVAYDAKLLSKGILLNSAIEFESVLKEQGDPQLQALYETTKMNDAEIDRLRASAKSETDKKRILELSRQNQDLQLELYKGCAEFADFTDYISYDWREVQSKLGNGDVAIEFAAVKSNVFERDNYIYALVLTKDLRQPATVKMLSFADAKQMIENESLFESTDNQFWASLNEFLANRSATKRIFFSADGYLNNIGIEYLLYNGKPLSEQYEVYRLSSTKVLCGKREKPDYSKVTLIGDINYNNFATRSARSDASLMAMRSGGNVFNDLPATRREINGIYDMLQQGNISDIARLSGTEASDSAFLSLNNSRVALLHIATHGAFIDGKGLSDNDAMSRSLLAFAGANLNDDDETEGLVTATDIAGMNLRHCNLVVLSACETGLGKLGDDGVFGLQRGFKNAGAKSLIMSLKKVYDATTADLMIAFYRNLIQNKMSTRKALVEAQKAIRDSGHNEGKYWATFILLDALD